MSLREYQKKRDFSRTGEPAGKKKQGNKGALHFVIQKHDASRLHYDFRLEMDGVLKSWAVPKGLPFAHGEKHLAVQVEDHPLDYGGFEGIIPKGQYGGGTVMLWDHGTYEPGGPDSLKAWREGRLHFFLHGEKVQGEWSLVRMHREENQWLLLKSGDSIKPVSATRDNQSVTTHRTMLQIAKKHDAVWNSNRADGRPDKKSAKTPASSLLRKKKKASSGHAPKLKFVEPMKAKLIADAPSTGDWTYEVKFDGYRALALKDGDHVQLLSRNNKDFSVRFPEIVEAVQSLPVESAILDGEVTALDEKGRSSFQMLQGLDLTKKRPPLAYYLFDLLQVEDEDLRDQPLHKRKQRLESLLRGLSDPLRFSPALNASPARLLKEMKRLGFEGLIGKRTNSTYEPGQRSGTWIKLKCIMEQEFVIGGYTPPGGSRTNFGALLVGYYDRKKLVYCGKVGTGFNQALLESLHAKMNRLKVKTCPFVGLPESDEAGRWNQHITPAEFRKCHWVKPKLVAQLKFSEWTDEGKLRQPVFLGLREDKSASEVRRERPA